MRECDMLFICLCIYSVFVWCVRVGVEFCCCALRVLLFPPCLILNLISLGYNYKRTKTHKHA